MSHGMTTVGHSYVQFQCPLITIKKKKYGFISQLQPHLWNYKVVPPSYKLVYNPIN